MRKPFLLFAILSIAGVLILGCEASEVRMGMRVRAAWKPRSNDYQSGALWKYAQQVGPAHKGAVTHPGAGVEVACYADV